MGEPSTDSKGQYLTLQPIKDIHLRSNLEKEISANSNINNIYIFSIVALFILLIACINFINLATALAFKRMREVGVRKLLGAERAQLIFQFLGESFIVTIISTLVAIVLIYLALPAFNNITGREVAFVQVFNPFFLLVLLAVIVGVGLLSGLYPAFFVSGFKPVKSLKGQKDPNSNAAMVRKGLVVFQFVVSVFMIFSTIIILQQMNFFKTKDLGFDANNVVSVNLYGNLKNRFVQNTEALKNELERSTDVESVSLVSQLPGQRFGMEYIIPIELLNEEDLEVPTIRVLRADNDLINALSINMKDGRNFNESEGDKSSIILNQAAVEALELETPLGQQLVVASDQYAGEVVGVTENFNFASLKNKVEPLAITNNPLKSSKLLIKVREGANMRTALEYIEAKMDEFAPGYLFMNSFLDAELAKQYREEATISQVFNFFSILAILISCLGLFGLSAYSTELRIKEIGIRKVLGASIINIIGTLSKSFVALVLIAMVIALPLGYLAMNEWLQDFANRIAIQWFVFIISGVVALLIAFATVSYHAIRAGRANPVKSLRYE